jgi:hypothetical protein
MDLNYVPDRIALDLNMRKVMVNSKFPYDSMHKAHTLNDGEAVWNHDTDNAS